MDDNHSMRVESIETPTHGRVLVREGASPTAAVLGFHGYMENAEIQMDRLVALPGADAWTLISIQGLHRFYRGRSEEVVAGWMTRQDRDDMIGDNIEYVSRTLDRLVPVRMPFYTLGFSQGVAAAFRGGLRSRRRASGIVAVGGDVPPELFDDPSLQFPPILLTRGERDDWYTAPKLDSDLSSLRARHAPVDTLVYDGAHEWAPALASSISDWIRQS